MEKKRIAQKLKLTSDGLGIAEKYYTILSNVNSLALTEREIQLVAFTAIRGNISYGNIRQEFCERYKSSSATINNMISKLKKIHVLVKDGTKIKVNPKIILPFIDANITLIITLEHGL